MSKWNEFRLDELCSFISRGITPQYVDYGIPVVNQKCIRDNKVDLSLCRFTDTFQKIKEEKHIRYGDILINSTGTGTLGRVAIYRHNAEKISADGHVSILHAKKDINSIYLGYFLHSVEPLIENLGRGSTNQIELAAKDLKRIKIILPDLNTQNKIADILSTYDELIENNNKRIATLEQMAENLYKEWFVRFRFPGYETSEFKNGIPVGWEIKKVGKDNLLPIITGKKDANYGDDGGKYTFFTCAQKAIMAPNYSFDQSAIILAGNGDLSVKLFKGKFEAYQRVYVLTPYNLDYLNILYYVIKDELKTLTQGASGSTIRFITKGMIERISTLIPNEAILKQFNEIIDDIYEQKTLLEKANNNLIKQRDLLLPRLMSDKLEV